MGDTIGLDGAGPAASVGAGALATNAFVLGTAAAAGVSTKTVRADDTIAAFDATVPTTSAMGDAAAAGSAAFAAHRDHLHGRGTAARTFWVPVELMVLDSGTSVTLGAVPDAVHVIQLADAATQGAYFEMMVPDDWVSGNVSIAPVWAPGATDGVAHTVRWSVDALARSAGGDVTAAGTTSAWTGTSAARTINLLVIDTAQNMFTPAGANQYAKINLRRLGADAADTYVGAVNLLGVRIGYQANT